MTTTTSPRFGFSATVVDVEGEAYVKVSDLSALLLSASPQGQYERFQEAYVYDFMTAVRKAAEAS